MILTDKKDLDVIEYAGKNSSGISESLEIRREKSRKADYARVLKSETLMNHMNCAVHF